MIASLTGVVEAIGPDYAVITVGGIGFQVRMPSGDLMRLRTGGEAHVYTALSVSQDAIALDGFLSQAELDLYGQLLKVSGIGPKVALSVLSTLTPEQFADVVNRQDVAALTRTPGLGRKGAQKIILDLAGKLAIDAAEPRGAAGGGDDDPVASQLVDAMVSMGKDRTAAAQAVKKAMETLSIASPMPADKALESAVLSLAFRSTDTSR